MSDREKAVPASYLILGKDGKILLGLRKNTGYYDGWWTVPSGHVETGELPIGALIRETKEEIGISIYSKDIKLVHTMYRAKHDETGPRSDYFFAVSKWSGDIENMEQQKCVKLEWFPMDNLPEKTVHFVEQGIECYRKGINYSEIQFDKKFINPNIENNIDIERAIPILPPPYIFLGPLLIGIGVNILYPLSIFSINLRWRFLIFTLLFVAGGVLLYWAVKTLLRFKVDPRFKPVGGVVTGGPFSFTRNPMYVSFTLIYLAVTVAFNALWAVFFLPIIFYTLHYGVILREEKYLEATLGEEFLKYKARVRRWL